MPKPQAAKAHHASSRPAAAQMKPRADLPQELEDNAKMADIAGTMAKARKDNADADAQLLESDLMEAGIMRELGLGTV